MRKLYCINCGKDIPINASYCPFCGAAQHGAEAATFRAYAEPVVLRAAAVAINDSVEKDEVSSGAGSEPKKYEHIKSRKLCGNAVWMFFFSYFIKSSVILLLLITTAFIEPFIFVIGLVLYLSLVYLAAVIVHNNFTYQTDDIGFKKNYGVIHKMQVTIPYSKIQNVNIRRSLLDRMLGLCHVSIETAGNAAGTVTDIAQTLTTSEGYLPGLTLEEAKELHDMLLSYAQGQND
jgi:membrane protein YdbS with pleckstrin-like domain